MSQDTRGIRYGFRIVVGTLVVLALAVFLIVLVAARR